MKYVALVTLVIDTDKLENIRDADDVEAWLNANIVVGPLNNPDEITVTSVMATK